MTNTFHVFALEYARNAETGDEPVQHLIGTAASEADAIALCRSEGWKPFIDGEGGTVNQYDAEDAPRVYGYEADGLGAISVTVYA